MFHNIDQNYIYNAIYCQIVQCQLVSDQSKVDCSEFELSAASHTLPRVICCQLLIPSSGESGSMFSDEMIEDPR